MRIKARVLDYKNGKAYLETLPEGQCVGCKGCSQAEAKELIIKADPIKPGSCVWISMEKSDVTRAALLGYGLPLVLFMLGLFLGIELFKETSYDGVSELIGLGLGLLLFTGTYLILRISEKKRQEDLSYQAKILSQIEEEIWNL